MAHAPHLHLAGLHGIPSINESAYLGYGKTESLEGYRSHDLSDSQIGEYQRILCLSLVGLFLCLLTGVPNPISVTHSQKHQAMGGVGSNGTIYTESKAGSHETLNMRQKYKADLVISI